MGVCGASAIPNTAFASLQPQRQREKAMTEFEKALALVLGETWQTIVADISAKAPKKRTAAEQAIIANLVKFSSN